MPIITLVITMVVAGQDVERHERMSSIEECWSKARTIMETMRDSTHANSASEVSKIGIGCVVDAGDPI